MSDTCSLCGGEYDELIEMDVTDPAEWDGVNATGCTTEEGLYVHEKTEAQIDGPDPDDPNVRSETKTITSN